MSPYRVPWVALPLVFATYVLGAKYNNDQNGDPTGAPKLTCMKSIYDIDPHEKINAADYTDMTSLCAWSHDGHPTLGCDCSAGVPQCYREKADTSLYDYAIWPPIIANQSQVPVE